MNGNLMRNFCALALVSSAFSHASVLAAITGGEVTGGNTTGGFDLLDPPPATVGPDAFQSPNLVAFDELQDVVLAEDLMLGQGRVLPAGSVLSSHYVAFDPATGTTIEGFVTFDDPIVAIIGGPPGLDATEELFGLPSVTYSVGPAVGPDGQGGPQGDLFAPAPMNPNRMNVRAAANSPGDQVRVLTGFVVPEPATAFILVAAAPILAFGFGGRPSLRRLR